MKSACSRGSQDTRISALPEAQGGGAQVEKDGLLDPLSAGPGSGLACRREKVRSTVRRGRKWWAKAYRFANFSVGGHALVTPFGRDYSSSVVLACPDDRIVPSASGTSAAPSHDVVLILDTRA